ncbi:Crp/Fnr family transcriptional regulator [Mucilaginibacter endophyticus]|uniref:Crp/Fnr family transcriptional regulator n=1 Tax=Mucilaginibacter endophyticus TaxID=2675003 RepID=UPI000E0D8F80|nr:Crp/Fnr family transcriptional regulator [Mucilaginibacter endophyticus]
MDELIQLLNHHHQFPLRAWRLLLSETQTLSFKKNTQFNLDSGKFHEKQIFVIKGHFKQFYYQEDGSEKIISFGFPGDYLLQHASAPMRITVQSLSNAEVLIFEMNLHQNCTCLSHRFLADICNYSIKQYADHLYILGLRTPVERYDYLSQHKPEIANNVALIDLSKYLNTSREALSRARISALKKIKGKL